MLAQHLKTWSMAINEDNGDIDEAPMSLAKTLMPSKSGTKNPFRDTGDKPVAKDTTPAHPPNLPPSHYYQYPPSYYPYGASPHYPQLPPPLLQHQQLPMQAAPGPEHAPKSPHRSSSVPSEADGLIDKLAEYFNWLTRLNPTKAEQLGQCFETLKKQDIVFGTVTDITDELFEVWGISHGLRLLLKSHMKKWERAKAKGRA